MAPRSCQNVACATFYSERNQTLPLRLRHLVNAIELIHQPLLLPLGKPVERRIVVQYPFLVLRGNIAMLVEP